jgi:hypothetical protein
MSSTDREPIWDPDAHLDRVYRRGRQLRRRRIGGAATVTALVVLSVVALISGVTNSHRGRQVLTAGGADAPSTTGPRAVEPTGLPGTTVSGVAPLTAVLTPAPHPGGSAQTTNATTGATTPPSTVAARPPTVAPPATTTTVASSPGPCPSTATEADNGKTCSVHIGATLVVRLGGGWVWSEPMSSDAKVLQGGPESMNPGGYTMRSFAAVGAGRAQVTSTGNLACYYLKPPCLVASQGFNITVEVRS